MGAGNSRKDHEKHFPQVGTCIVLTVKIVSTEQLLNISAALVIFINSIAVGIIRLASPGSIALVLIREIDNERLQ